MPREHVRRGHVGVWEPTEGETDACFRASVSASVTSAACMLPLFEGNFPPAWRRTLSTDLPGWLHTCLASLFHAVTSLCRSHMQSVGSKAETTWAGSWGRLGGRMLASVSVSRSWTLRRTRLRGSTVLFGNGTARAIHQEPELAQLGSRRERSGCWLRRISVGKLDGPTSPIEAG